MTTQKLLASATTAAELDALADALIAPEPPCPFASPCGCGWTRCATHQAMMDRVHDVWNHPLSDEQWLAVDREADGFGYGAGSMGGDWSGIRDSSPEAVERMFAAAERFARFVG